MLMDKKLRAYADYIKKESKHPSKELIEFHLTQVQHFQHERLIHLIVTMFFALFMIIVFILFIALSLTLGSDLGSQLILGWTGLILLIFLIVTLFYVRHYYQLENGTQELQDYTRILYERDYCKKK